ncbi:MAG: hypothetical protein ACOY4R_27460 [Pseudomonadota bacterium]
MSTKPPNDKEIISDIGVDALTSAGFEVHNVKKWMQRGIPWKDRARVASIAAGMGKAVPPDFLQARRLPEEAAPKRQRRAAA